MDNTFYFKRFPEIAELIFDNLDNKNFVKCKKVNRDWNTFLLAPKFFLMRKIQKTVETRHEFTKAWRNVAKNTNNN